MRALVIFGLTLLALQQCVAPPVTKSKDEKDEKTDAPNGDERLEESIGYHAYLKEIVELLEKDPEFRSKLEKADEADIKSGKIADELDFVHHDLRTQLDEVKRRELQRLRHLATLEYEIENGIDPSHANIDEHIDHANPHSFEVKDLKKLIAKTTEDLAIVDRQRRVKFQEYEMQQKFEEEEKLKKMNEEQKKQYEEEHKKLVEEQKKHVPLHHPGGKQQLEEVWENQDHMENQEFNPRAFFKMHDVDGNNVWDEDEVKALFVKELNKLYGKGPNTDIHKRAEEMERMRERVFIEMDRNNDGLISYAEFEEQSKKPEFEKDDGWETLDEQQIYTQEDYERYKLQHQEEIERRAAKGMSTPDHGIYDPGHPEQFAPMYVDAPIDHNQIQQQQQQQQQFPGQIPHQQQQFHGQIPHEQQQFHGQVPPQQQQYQGQVPHHQQQQFQEQQYVPQYQQNIPQYQGQQNIPQYQGHQVPQYQDNSINGGQIPQYQQGQMSHQQQLQGQVPVQQAHGQVPVHQAQGQVPHQQVQGQVPHQQVRGQVPHQQVQGQVPHQQVQGQGPDQHAQGQVPVQHVQGQVPVQHVQSQVPAQHVQGQVPVQHVQGHAPVQHVQGQVPVQHVQGQVPVQQQLNGEAKVQEQHGNVQHGTNNKLPSEIGHDTVDNAHNKHGNSAKAAPASPQVVQT